MVWMGSTFEQARAKAWPAVAIVLILIGAAIMLELTPITSTTAQTVLGVLSVVAGAVIFVNEFS